VTGNSAPAYGFYEILPGDPEYTEKRDFILAF
jgi:hypothetical protein